jgi:predicted ATP-grasp superfamily ATP-dependent carboligase
VRIPVGVEGVRDTRAAQAALDRLGTDAVVKLDTGVTGDGNALVAAGADLAMLPETIRAGLAGGAVVEERITGAEVTSPSAQVRIDGAGGVEVLSTHEQELDGHRYVGCRLPAQRAYAPDIARAAVRVGRVLAREGARGRFGVDFVARREADDTWTTYAVEVNLRAGATTHPLGTLALLTGGRYDAATATFRSPTGRELSYVATDRATSSLPAAELARSTPRYDPASECGVVLFMLSALARSGRVGYVAINANPITSIELGKLDA